MKTIILDLTGCKSLWDIHERIRKAFDFPEWYGKNWDAFWDLLRTECDANTVILKVIIKGEYTIPVEYKEHLHTMHSILDKEIVFRKEYAKYNFAPFFYEIES